MKFDGKLPDAYAFALVEQCQKDKIRLRLFLGDEVKRLNINQIQIRQRLLNMVHVVSEVKKICFLEKFVNIYVDDITEDCAWKLSKPLKEYIESSHNDSQTQLEAIYLHLLIEFPLDLLQTGLSRKCFVLIQGPPGTGKTQTILGLLSAILHATPPRVQSNEGKQVGVKRGPKFPIQENTSPWLSGINPRGVIMPVDGDDGFFPTSGNDMGKAFFL
ncbi:hypothetical protein OROGR_030754 [Orobanche gracilis]